MIHTYCGIPVIVVIQPRGKRVAIATAPWCLNHFIAYAVEEKPDGLASSIEGIVHVSRRVLGYKHRGVKVPRAKVQCHLMFGRLYA